MILVNFGSVSASEDWVWISEELLRSKRRYMRMLEESSNESELDNPKSVHENFIPCCGYNSYVICFYTSNLVFLKLSIMNLL